VAGSLGQATEALGKAPDPPPPVEAPTASLAAVAVSTLRVHGPRTQSGESTRIYQRAVTAVGHLLSGTEATYIEEYTRYLSDAFGPAVRPAVVDELAAEKTMTRQGVGSGAAGRGEPARPNPK
jgi:hypothetical protein